MAPKGGIQYVCLKARPYHVFYIFSVPVVCVLSVMCYIVLSRSYGLNISSIWNFKKNKEEEEKSLNLLKDETSRALK